MLATWEAEIWRTEVPDQFRQKNLQDSMSMKKETKLGFVQYACPPSYGQKE
jgi:hypothetical protein